MGCILFLMGAPRLFYEFLEKIPKVFIAVLCMTESWTELVVGVTLDCIDCIQMPAVLRPFHPEGQFRQQLCNIWLGRSPELQGKVITRRLLNRCQFSYKSFHTNQKSVNDGLYLNLSKLESTKALGKRRAIWEQIVLLLWSTLRWFFFMALKCFSPVIPG